MLPGLIDVHVHLTGSGGMFGSSEDYDERKAMPHAAAALLYSGVTAARSTGDGLDASLKARAEIGSAAKLGAQLFICGPMFTAEGGHGTEFIRNVPEAIRPDRCRANCPHAENARGSAPAGADHEARGRRWH